MVAQILPDGDGFIAVWNYLLDDVVFLLQTVEQERLE